MSNDELDDIIKAKIQAFQQDMVERYEAGRASMDAMDEDKIRSIKAVMSETSQAFLEQRTGRKFRVSLVFTPLDEDSKAPPGISLN